MKLQTLCEIYDPELHYDPEKALRKTELAIQHTKGQIESIEETLDTLKRWQGRGKDGNPVISKSTQDKIKYYEQLIKKHQANIAKWEAEADEFRKHIEKQKVNEELNENLKDNLKIAGKAIANRTAQFIKNRAKSVKQRFIDDKARVEQAEQEVKNLKNAQSRHSSIGGKEYMEDEAGIKKAEEKAKAARKSTLLSKLRRRTAIIVALLVLFANMAKPFTNPNLLMKEMNINTIERRLNELDGVVAEKEPEILNNINSIEKLQDQYDKYKEEFKSINFDENGKPKTEEDAKKLNNLAYKVKETTDKAIMEIDGKTTDSAVKAIYRGFGNLIGNVKEFFKNISIRFGFGERFNPRG